MLFDRNKYNMASFIGDQKISLTQFYSFRGKKADWSNSPGFQDAVKSIPIKPDKIFIRLLDFDKRDILIKLWEKI